MPLTFDAETHQRYIRESSLQWAAAASVTLSKESAAGLSEVCATFVNRSMQQSALELARLGQRCGRLCDEILKGVDYSRQVFADELFKSAIAVMQSALLAMSNDAEVHDIFPGQVQRIENKILQWLNEEEQKPLDVNLNAFVDPQADFTLLNDAVGKLTHTQVLNETTKGLQPEGTDQSSEELLKLISSLTEKIQANESYRDLAFQVAEAAQVAHSYRFSQLCGAVPTLTPEVAVEKELAAIIQMQLAEWTQGEELNIKKHTCALRMVGGVLWLELRVPFYGQLPSKNQSSSKQKTGVVLFSEDYLWNDQRVRRACYRLILPTFRAYEVMSNGRSFLVPQQDVIGVLDSLPNSVKEPAGEFERVSLSDLVDLDAKWMETECKGLVIQYRDRKIVLATGAQIRGPSVYYAKNVEDSGIDQRGVVGVARLPEGRRAVILDLYPWLETLTARRDERAREQNEMKKWAGNYVVFRVSGRRYAVPQSRVVAVGRLDSESVLIGLVETKNGHFLFRDLKPVLGVEGEAGGNYVVIRSAQGVVAWGVDGVEKIFTVTEQDVSTSGLRASSFSYLRNQAGGELIKGVLPGAQSHPGAPVYLIEADCLKPLVRVSRSLKRAA